LQEVSGFVDMGRKEKYISCGENREMAQKINPAGQFSM